MRGDFMEAIKIEEVVKKDGEIKMSGLPLKKGQRVELIVLKEPYAEESTGSTARNLLKSSMVGLWKDYPPAISWLNSCSDEIIALPGFVLMELIQGCKTKTEQQTLSTELKTY